MHLNLLKYFTLVILASFLSACQLTSLFQDPAFQTIEAEETTFETGLEQLSFILPPKKTQNKVRNDLSPLQQHDLWDRVRLQLSLTIPKHPLITTHRNWYEKHPNYIERVTQRAAPYLYLIIEEIEKRDLPLELVLVPIVESAYDTFAYSHGRASGIWQFIPSTARHYGLEIDWWYDGRRDLIASTQTALDYFDRLQALFDGDWLLALAAYNGGQGRVAAAVRKNKAAGLPTDFWSLQLPRETRNYVPKILALSSLLAERHQNQLVWRYVPNQPVLEKVDLDKQIDLALAASLSSLPLDELHRYNAGYNRWATSPSGPHYLLMPKQSAEKFQAALATTDPSQWVLWERHRVRQGESLITIARQYKTTPQALQQANNIKGSLIRAGEFLLIPVASQSLSQYALSSEQRVIAAQQKAPSDNAEKISHTVVSGDNLWDLSRKYNVSVAQLAQWNNIARNDPLSLGQKLVVWIINTPNNTSVAQHPGITRTIQYQVKKGDSLNLIANRFNVRIADIEKWNNINRNIYLQPGQQLTLHLNITQGG